MDGAYTSVPILSQISTEVVRDWRLNMRDSFPKKMREHVPGLLIQTHWILEHITENLHISKNHNYNYYLEWWFEVS